MTTNVFHRTNDDDDTHSKEQLDAMAADNKPTALPPSEFNVTPMVQQNQARSAGNSTAISAALQQPHGVAPKDRDSLISDIVDAVLASIGHITLPDLLDPTSKVPEDTRAGILAQIELCFALENQARSKDVPKLKVPDSLPGYVVARIVMATGAIRTMLTGQSGHRMIAKHYYRDGNGYKWAGTYDIVDEMDSAGPIMRIFQRLCPDGNGHAETTFRRELRNAPRVRVQSDDKLVWWRNGVWDYRTYTLTPYDDPEFDRIYPDQIALGKLPVNHPRGPGAVLRPDENGVVAEPVIHNDKDGTDWHPGQMLTDPFDMTTAEGQSSSLIIWQAMQFLVRHINGAPNLYHFWVNSNGRGHNGKGAIWAMMQRLVDKPMEPGDDDLTVCGDRVIPLAIESLDADYVLAQNIMTAYAIVGEESNGSVTYVDKCATAKMLARSQEMTFRIIREAPFKFRYNGFLLQQSNRAPIFAEKNDSVISHTVVIKFERCFGDNRPYIKDDYVLREEVAEWLAYHITCEMQCLDSYSPDALAVLEPNKREMLAESMPTMRCLDEIIPGLHMEFMPVEMLYEIYLIWCERCGEKPVSERTLRDDLQQYAIHNPYSIRYVGTDERVRTRTADINEWHPALAEYSQSRRHGPNIYVDHNAWLAADNGRHAGRLDQSMMLMQTASGKTKGRIWCKGGLMRTIPWQQFQVTDDDE